MYLCIHEEFIETVSETLKLPCFAYLDVNGLLFIDLILSRHLIQLMWIFPFTLFQPKNFVAR